MCWLTRGGESVRGDGGAGGGCNRRVEKGTVHWGLLGNSILGKTRALTQCPQQTTTVVWAPKPQQDTGSGSGLPGHRQKVGLRPPLCPGAGQPRLPPTAPPASLG